MFHVKRYANSISQGINNRNVSIGAEKLKNGAETMGVALSAEQVGKLLSYCDMLIEANKHMNLTAIDDPETVITHHFLDSLAPLAVQETAKKLQIPGKTLIDVGTGSGFPGLPLAIAVPELQVTLLDSLNKRVNFLETVIAELNLKNAKTICGRAEDMAKTTEMRENFDFAVSRAVAGLSVLCEYDLPFVKEGGTFLAYKGKEAQEEVRNATNALEILGGKATIEPYNIPETELEHVLVVVEKIAGTPEKYPRRAGIPSKRPL